MNIFGFALLAFWVVLVFASICIAPTPPRVALELVLGAVYLMWVYAAVTPRNKK